MKCRYLNLLLCGASISFLAGCSTLHLGGASFRGDRKAFPSNTEATGQKYFVFSPKYLAWGAYSADGRLVGYGKASGGSHWCKELKRPCRTPVGTFRIRSEGKYDCRSGKYPLPKGGAHMPYCMFFLDSYAIHGAPPGYVPNHNASHGCIRVTERAAKWLRDHFIQIGTQVKVMSY